MLRCMIASAGPDPASMAMHVFPSHDSLRFTVGTDEVVLTLADSFGLGGAGGLPPARPRDHARPLRGWSQIGAEIADLV